MRGKNPEMQRVNETGCCFFFRYIIQITLNAVLFRWGDLFTFHSVSSSTGENYTKTVAFSFFFWYRDNNKNRKGVSV